MSTAVAASTEYGWTTGQLGVSQRYNLQPMLDLAGPLGEGTRVLDLGCGNGVIAREFASRGCTVVGIDPGDRSREFFEAEAAKHPARDRLRFVQDEGSLGAVDRLLSGGEAPFDVAISSQVIEHVYDPWDFCRACVAGVKPGGRVVISTPYHGFLKNLLLSLTNRWDKHHTTLKTGMHIKFFSRATLSTLMSRCGLESLEFRGIGRYPGLWRSMAIAGRRGPGAGDGG
ncbi:MAG: class I SAM-dependent methyltransferase [Phycisphaerales bacterium JB037]